MIANHQGNRMRKVEIIRKRMTNYLMDRIYPIILFISSSVQWKYKIWALFFISPLFIYVSLFSLIIKSKSLLFYLILLF